MSEVVSTRLPRGLVELMEREAKARGASLSMLLRAIVEERYGVERGGATVKPFLLRLEEAVEAMGRAKESGCALREACPLRGLGLEPSPLTCALCQVHGHSAGFLQTSQFNPYAPG